MWLTVGSSVSGQGKQVKAVFANKLHKPKKPEDMMKHIGNKTKAYVKAQTGGKGPCWEDFKVSFKTYADARFTELDGCKKAKNCVIGVINGMRSDAELAVGSANKCYKKCGKVGCKEN
ncbi:uncharacterized protein LOC117170082 [Belonocnema kinseyi]|uniref:uncharacterized protein LOC117170082 n=1 Tax=Belonocnema kinseyi TaxID=2817044 RepID=UPI00143CE6A0|nr:uncharacterized protein LOC117170082 [Belonocnema kinseyi]